MKEHSNLPGWPDNTPPEVYMTFNFHSNTLLGWAGEENTKEFFARLL